MQELLTGSLGPKSKDLRRGTQEFLTQIFSYADCSRIVC